MEFEFDKEMDAILRRARREEAAVLPEAHLDADEISAFAESAVSESAGKRYTAHLADCSRCRKILSQTVLLNSEAETESASSAVSAAAASAAAPQTSGEPWYRRLFAFPQLAYSMGALVLLFSGFFAYLILQNMSGAGGSDVSYSTNTAARSSEAPAAAPQFAPQNSTNANASANVAVPSTNSSAATNAASTTRSETLSTTNGAPVSTSDAPVPASTPALPPAKTIAPEDDISSAEVLTTPAPVPAPKPVARDEDKNLAKTVPATPNRPSAAGAVAQENRSAKEDSFQPDGDSRTRNSDGRMNAERSAPSEKKKTAARAGEQRSAGGKTFNNVGGIWFDSAYGSQKQKSVNRGSSEYQKLDAGLRSIADQLGGTVVVLWKGRAYRIQ